MLASQNQQNLLMNSLGNAGHHRQQSLGAVQMGDQPGGSQHGLQGMHASKHTIRSPKTNA